ncbi:MAG: hypothetical protein KIT69_08525 [Propionibacteriaceae bacterium]|nr:hypothetical protein [Propionibacteriaceae bacterium]
MTHESPRRQRARLQAERRAAASGSGPAAPGFEVPRFPGATNKFALFGEIMLVGFIATLLSLPVVTLPLALAVSARHLRRYLKGEASGVRAFADDVKAGFAGGLLVGLGMLVLLAAGTLSLFIAPTDLTGFGTVMTVVAWISIAAAAVVVLMLAGDWEPVTGWRGAIRRIGDRFEADPLAAGYLLLTAALVVVCAWQLGPLVIPALGVAVFLVVVLRERREPPTSTPEPE